MIKIKSVKSVVNPLNLRSSTGQSLVELMIAMGVFVLAVTAISWLILDVYLADRAGRERMEATFLSKEGMEAAKSIRDNNWDNLTNSSHGLAIYGGNWIFQDIEEDVSDQLREGKRKITVEEISSDRKKVTSQVTWKLTEARSQEVVLTTYLTNWAEFIPFDCASYCQSIGYSDGICRARPARCSANGETYESGGDEYCTGGPQQDTCCCAP